jgi:multiple sugar transport system permease protein
MATISSAPRPPRRRRRRSATDAGRSALAYALLALLAIAALVPFLWMISTSLKNIDEVFVSPPVWIPSDFRWENYTSLWDDFPIGTWVFNSLKIAAIVVAGDLIVCSMAAYAFARLRFPGRDLIFYVYLATLMIPGSVTLIPSYILMRDLGWIDSHLAVTIPSIGSVFAIFLLRQYFRSIPRELDDAAKIDGAGHFYIYTRIILPLSVPSLIIVAVLSFLGVWGDFLWPLIVLNSSEQYTLNVGLGFLNGQYETDWVRLMAGDTMAVVPLVLIYFVAQKWFVQGLAYGGIKG